MIVDSHVHVWEPQLLRYPWLEDESDLRRSLLPPAIETVAQSTRMVFVQADCLPEQALDEVRWVTSLHWPELAGVVAAVNLRSPHLEGDLEALRAFPAVVGVRHILQQYGVDELADLAAPLARVAASGLVFDACVRHEQLSALADLVENVPGLPVVLDHLGKPPVNAGIDSEDGTVWARVIDRLAARSLTAVKLSGLSAEAADREAFDRHAAAFLSYALAAFGPTRCMLGSDFPVSTLSGARVTFAQFVETVRAVTDSRSGSWDSVSHGTARQWYRLPA
ncbi:amidohydrolase family protein [Microbacterium sp. F51-2R]|uniref:amidohydrolase family protein n=1 Tax=Microbacterium sp. F51-2R TaxID=3445777 RepID=UPI003FA0D141